jgi:hypothetical protein
MLNWAFFPLHFINETLGEVKSKQKLHSLGMCSTRNLKTLLVPATQRKNPSPQAYLVQGISSVPVVELIHL